MPDRRLAVPAAMLPYAILSLLCAGADHGYRLKRRLDERLGPVWRVNEGQVYQTLDRLRRQRWIEELPPEVDRYGGHERWPVAITRQGRAELQRWMGAPIPPTRPPRPARSEILTRLAVGEDAGIEQAHQALLTERAIYELEYERISSECDQLATATSPVDIAKFLALESTRLAVRAHIEWTELATLRLNAAAECPPLSPKRAAGAPR